MPIGTTAAIIGASAIGAGASMLGSSKAASAQKDAARSAEATQLAMFNQTRDDQSPYRMAGENALAVLSSEFGMGARPNNVFQDDEGRWTFSGSGATFGSWGDAARRLRERGGSIYATGFEETPGYAFMRNEGTKAIDRSAAARGMSRSGATLKAQDKFGQGIAAQEYGNYLNRLSAMAGIGQSSTAQTNALGASTAANIGNAQMAAGAARGSAYQQMGQEVGNFAGNALAGASYGGLLQPQTNFPPLWRP